MTKNKVGLVFALDAVAVFIYWAVLLFAMRRRIGTMYGQYEWFETLSLMRSLVIPLLVILIGALFFFKGYLKGLQYLAVSISVPVILEVLGNLAAMALYKQPFGAVSEMLQMPFQFFMYLVITFILWGILSIVYRILKAVKTKNTTPGIQSNSEPEPQETTPLQDSVYAGPVCSYSSSGLPFVGYWFMWLAICSTAVFFITGFIMLYLLDNKNPAILLSALGIAIILSAIISLLRGVMRVSIENDTVIIRQWNKIIGAYSFENFLITSEKTVHLVASVIPVKTDRYLVLTDKSGYSIPIHCRNFSEKTFIALMDEINARQRFIVRAAEADKNTAAIVEAQPGGPVLQRAGTIRAAHAMPSIKYKQMASSAKILPMPGEDDFVALDFTINKGQMVSAEQKRYRHIMLGLLLCSVALFVVWYLFVYKTAPSPAPNLPFITGGLIAIVFFIAPVLVMTLRFTQEQKRIPASIIVESRRFTIDSLVFERANVQNFKITHPQEVKIGTASHRMHIAFLYENRHFVYTLGSGTVPKASFPDYNLLYKAFDAQRAYLAQPAAAPCQNGRMLQTRVKLSPFTFATIKVFPIEELVKIARIISGNSPGIASEAQDIVNDPYRYAAAHHDDFIRYGIYNPFITSADVVARTGTAILLELHQFSILLEENSNTVTMLCKLGGIINTHSLPIDLSSFQYNENEYALEKLQELNTQLLPQGYQIADLNSSGSYNLFFYKTAEWNELKELAKKAEWNIFFDFAL